MSRKNGFNTTLAKLGGGKLTTPRTTKPTVPLVEKNSSALVMVLMLEALRVDDDNLNNIAAELIVRFGAEPVRRLTLAATDPQNTTKHRLRLLDVIRRIGDIGDPSNFVDLFTLTHDKDPKIREAVVRLIATSRQHQDKPPDA